MPMQQSIPADVRLTAPSEAVAEALPNETIILDPEGRNYFSLTGVGTRVWELLQEGTTRNSLVCTITTEYDVGQARAQEDIDALLEDLRRHGLLLVGDAHV